MRIVHAADLHIDSPLVGLERYPGVPVERVRTATRAAFSRVIDLCRSERARFLVLAGDVFDGDWRDVHTGLFFVSELAKLRDVGCDVLLLRGNHDFELTSALRFPSHVHSFAHAAAREGDHSFVFESDGVAFHGLSYPTKHVRENLVDRYPSRIPGLINVGVLHTNASGSKGGAQHESYAPCSVDDLVAKSYDYWALGHVHTHEVLRRDPFVVYPGNTQGRSVRELGDKGCVVVETEGAHVVDVRFRSTAVMRWFSEEIVLGADDDVDDLHDAVHAQLDEVGKIAGDVPAAVRVVVRGGCRAHATVAREPQSIVDQIRSDANDRHRGALWMEKIELATSPRTSMEELRAASDLVADLLQHAARLRDDDDASDLLALGKKLEPLKKKLGREMEELEIDVADRAFLERCLERAEAWLAERLAPEGEG